MSEIQFTKGEKDMEKTLLENICEQIRMTKEEQFCRKIYDMVQDYCCKKDFHLSKEERKIIHDVGLEESFLFWMESRGKQIGYQVVYEYKGYLLPAGNPQIFPEREIAEKYRRNYLKYPWADHELFLEEVVCEGKPLKERQEYHGKKVCNMEWYCGIGALEAGDLVDSDIVDLIINCLPPACMRSDCTQLGEPTDHRMDGDKLKPVFATFRRIEGDIWEFCGSCFQGENAERGVETPYC